MYFLKTMCVVAYSKGERFVPCGLVIGPLIMNGYFLEELKPQGPDQEKYWALSLQTFCISQKKQTRRKYGMTFAHILIRPCILKL